MQCFIPSASPEIAQEYTHPRSRFQPETATAPSTKQGCRDEPLQRAVPNSSASSASCPALWSATVLYVGTGGRRDPARCARAVATHCAAGKLSDVANWSRREEPAPVETGAGRITAVFALRAVAVYQFLHVSNGVSRRLPWLRGHDGCGQYPKQTDDQYDPPVGRSGAVGRYSCREAV